MPKKRRVESNESSSNSVGDILSSLQEALSKREEELEAREEKLRKDRERFEAERAKDYGKTQPGDVLHLNIGGVQTAVLRRTLTSIPDSMLASKFSGRWDDSLEKDKDGNFFIDQDYSLFKYIIEYLRNKANETEEYALKSPDVLKDTFDSGKLQAFHQMREWGYEADKMPDELKDKGRNLDKLREFYRMVEYYGLTNGIYPTRLIASKPEDSMELLENKKAHSNEWKQHVNSLERHLCIIG